MKYIKDSTSTKEKFEEIIVEIGINCGSRPTHDVPIHGNTTCDVLGSALHLEKFFMS